ncbi:hypothetical protein Dda_5205 [Drechslerella dactyloides]|uniref:Uncharacterized protein n=1 Tax=Drechslerella dactyloides TaxID=74499 RepID=A0AAD6NJZ9_DREDA|nr:hypothetical protein Dda_5205 [Drechslerella dactyloides]
MLVLSVNSPRLLGGLPIAKLRATLSIEVASVASGAKSRPASTIVRGARLGAAGAWNREGRLAATAAVAPIVAAERDISKTTLTVDNAVKGISSTRPQIPPGLVGGVLGQVTWDVEVDETLVVLVPSASEMTELDSLGGAEVEDVDSAAIKVEELAEDVKPDSSKVLDDTVLVEEVLVGGVGYE